MIRQGSEQHFLLNANANVYDAFYFHKTFNKNNVIISCCRMKQRI